VASLAVGPLASSGAAPADSADAPALGALAQAATSAEVGSGPDQLVLTISQDAYQGDAQYTVSVDGQQVGDRVTAAAAHGSDQDTVTVRGDWAAGRHELAVRFLDDAWDGTPETDRNLYLEAVTYNGAEVADAARTLWSDSEPATVTVTDEGEAPGDPGDPGDPGTPEGSFVETFDDGVGALSHTWGDLSAIDTSVPGEVTVTRTSGFMEWPSGPDAGHGYGTFSFTARMRGNAPGPALVLWPADDQWPGQEFDLGEVLPDGRPYLTTHWKGDDGNDAHNAHIVDWLDEEQWHTYALRWEPGKLTYTVDDTVVGVDTEHVPADYAHGGMNDVFGVMNQPNETTSLTVTEVRWTPLS
jgi:hypothetical protein